MTSKDSLSIRLAQVNALQQGLRNAGTHCMAGDSNFKPSENSLHPLCPSRLNGTDRSSAIRLNQCQALLKQLPTPRTRAIIGGDYNVKVEI